MDVEGAVARIEHLLNLGKYDAARKAIDAALRREPEERWFHLCRAELELLAGDRREAIRQADSLVGQYPDWCRAFYLKARINVTLLDFAAGGAAIREALTISPQVPEYLARLSHVQLVMHELAEATETASAALAINPGNVLALNVRSNALLRQGLPEEAAAAYRAGLAAAPDDPHNHLNFARYQAALGHYHSAQEHYRTSLRLHPGFDLARTELVEAVKMAHCNYRDYRKFATWSAGPEVQGGLSSLVMVGGSLGGMAILKTLPWPLALQYLLFGLLLLPALFGVRQIVDPVTHWLLYAEPGHRVLLAQREWRLTFAVTAGLTIGIFGSVSFLVTTSATALAIMTYGFTLILPAYAVFGDPPVAGPGRLLAAALPPLAMAGTVATYFTYAAEPFYALYFICLICLVGVLTRPPQGQPEK